MSVEKRLPIQAQAMGEKRVQAFVDLRLARVQGLSAERILSLVPADALAEIKRRDAHPFFQAYSICHEGKSTPTILGDTARPISWPRAAVQSIKQTVLRGVKFFLGHNEDNSTEGREALGEVVASADMEIDGVLNHVVVGYFPDRAKVVNLDICSQEGEWSFLEEAGQWIADKLHAITGIALSDSAHDEPAFSGAKRLAMVQALDSIKVVGAVGADGKLKRRGVRAMSDIDLTTVAWSDLQREFERRRLLPSQVFKVDDLKKDPEFRGVFEASEATTAELKKAKDALASLTKAQEETAKALQTSTAKERFEKVLTTLTLTPRQREYAKNAFPAKLEDASDEALKRIIDASLESYKVAAKTFGVVDELPAQRGASEGDSKDGTDFNKVKDNELLKEDAII
jgi:hypothetical protein